MCIIGVWCDSACGTLYCICCCRIRLEREASSQLCAELAEHCVVGSRVVLRWVGEMVAALV